jgi:hypothetical protein
MISQFKVLETIREKSPPRLNLHRLSRVKAKDKGPSPRAFLKAIDTNIPSSEPMSLDTDVDISSVHGRRSSPLPSSPVISASVSGRSSPDPSGTIPPHESRAGDKPSTKNGKDLDLPEPPFADTYSPHAKDDPKAGDYAGDVPPTINRARQDYQCLCLTEHPFPTAAQRKESTTKCWKKALKITGIRYKLTSRVRSIVSLVFLHDLSHFLV